MGKTVEEWFAVLEKIAYCGPVVFCPKIGTSAHFTKECDRISEMIREYAASKGAGK
jgi:hypothetical protein